MKIGPDNRGIGHQMIHPPQELGPFRDNAVHVRSEKCETCIFHPGNRMHLNPGVVAEMKRGADENGTAIICHENMNTPQATVCRGYYDSHKSALLQIAERMGLIREDA